MLRGLPEAMVRYVRTAVTTSREAAKLGTVFVPVNFRLATREIGRILAGCEPAVLFAGTSMAGVVTELGAAGVLPQEVVTMADELPEPPAAFADWFAAHPALEPDTQVAAAEVQLLVHSSGTTGQPKGVIWTHATTLASASAKVVDFALGPDDATAVFGPLFHVGPLMDLAVPVLLRGGKLVIGASTGFDPAEVLRTAADERVTVMTIYPTMWRRVIALLDIEDYDLSNLRLLFTGGEPIPLPVLREVYRRFPSAGFVNTYGSTEGGPITTFLAPQEAQRKIGSVGKAAFSVDLRVVDGDGKALCRDKVGELAVRSPFVCGGYWRRPEDTAASLQRGWWHTGDLARIDDEGFVWIAGRKKDMIISGAENIYPGEVEQVVAELPGVVEAAVVGVLDDEWGESVAAFVVRQPGSALDEAGIVEHCRRNLASYKKPRHVFFIDALPRTGANKVSKSALRELFGSLHRG
jgi:fatty-acyl-CoA synthase